MRNNYLSCLILKHDFSFQINSLFPILMELSSLNMMERISLNPFFLLFIYFLLFCTIGLNYEHCVRLIIDSTH